ncbi:mechanosensitive ion channel family protein [Flexithrix dorotheae]|uniref:mechanosensitive ion channel family protein n=1 Tax=Flexithrix dorotheae TaxID=70993 RepID=UPI0003647DB1|nr:mechanosensitive ion channel family protein [Flexithrix dorotheae]
MTNYSRILFLIFILGGLVQPVFAQKDSGNVDLSSPQASVITQLKFLQDESYNPELSAKALDGTEVSQEELIALTIKLKQIYDGSGHYIDTDMVPYDPNYRDTLKNNQNTYTVVAAFPQIYLSKVGNKWLYSRYTVSKIDEIHEEIYPYGTSELLEIANKLGKKGKLTSKKYLGLYLWQHIGLWLIIFFCFIGHKIFTFIFEKLILRLLIKFKGDQIANKFIAPVAKPLSFLVIIIFASLVFPILQFPITLSQYIIKFMRALQPFFAIVVVYRLIDVFCFYLEKATKKTETSLDDQIVPLLRKSLKLFVIVGGGLFILQNLEFDITGILAGISIGGLAFALAAQDTLKNLFGSLMIFIDRPFTIGDWIVSEGVDGTVEEVGFRSTRIRTFHNSVVSIPNGNIADMTVDNMGMRVYRRFRTSIAITYDTPPDLIEVFIEGLKQIVIKHPKTRKDYYEIHLNTFGASSLDILFYIFFAVPTWTEELQSRGEVMLEIIKLAEKLNVRFAFPTSTLHVEDFPEKKSLTPEYDQSKEEFMAKIKYLTESTQANGKH